MQDFLDKILNKCQQEGLPYPSSTSIGETCLIRWRLDESSYITSESYDDGETIYCLSSEDGIFHRLVDNNLFFENLPTIFNITHYQRSF